MNKLPSPPEALSNPADELDPSSSLTILPLRLSNPLRVTTSLHPLIHDEKACAGLLEELLQKGGLTISGAAKSLGISAQTLRQYVHGPRRSPSLRWFLKLAEACGARVLIEFPSGDRRF